MGPLVLSALAYAQLKLHDVLIATKLITKQAPWQTVRPAMLLQTLST
jgi:hypothetical protein